MNDDASREYTPFEDDVARICRSGERRDVLQLLRQGAWRTAAQRRDAARIVQAAAIQQRKLGTEPRSLAIRLANALDKGRDAATALFRELLEEEYREGLAAIQNIED